MTAEINDLLQDQEPTKKERHVEFTGIDSDKESEGNQRYKIIFLVSYCYCVLSDVFAKHILLFVYLLLTVTKIIVKMSRISQSKSVLRFTQYISLT